MPLIPVPTIAILRGFVSEKRAFIKIDTFSIGLVG
jgi:hypothetical protein